MPQYEGNDHGRAQRSNCEWWFLVSTVANLPIIREYRA